MLKILFLQRINSGLFTKNYQLKKAEKVILIKSTKIMNQKPELFHQKTGLFIPHVDNLIFEISS